MMKKSLYITLLFCMCLTSCKGFLNVKPQGKVLPETDEEFATIMHNRINDIEGGYDEYVIGNMDVISRREGCADDLDANIKVGSITAYAGDVINHRQTDYREIFEIIRDCNIVIENLEGRTTTMASDVLSAAYAMKGICYYNLIRDFCEPWDEGNADRQLGLPIVKKFDIKDMPVRSSLAATVEYTEGLLNKSLSKKMSDGKFFFTEYVVKAYLARLAFWTEDWDKTISICSDIIAESGISLTDISGYEDMIQSQYEPKGEVIVRSHISEASELGWYFTYVKGYMKTRPVSASLVSLFDKENDIRYKVCIDAKRMGVKQPEARIRLSEIVLMLSEAHYHIGEEEHALNWLNELRSKRILNAVDLTMDDLPAVRESDRIVENAEGEPLTPLLQAILDERRKELFLEGDRWFELKRNGCPEWWIINNGLKYTTKKYMYTAPIYKGDVDLNPDMKQNAGYE